MTKFKRLASILLSATMLCCTITGCNKSDSNKEEIKSSETVADISSKDEKTEKISGNYKVFSVLNIELLGANPNISIGLSKVKDSTFSKYIEYFKVKDKVASGYKLGDKVEILIKFKDDVDISELSLDDCTVNSETNLCTYQLTVDDVVGTYITGMEFINANKELDRVCQDYADTIADRIVGGTWGSNKKIQRVKNYRLVQSYCATNKKVNADDSVNLGKEVSRAGKAVNAIFREYAYDLVYEDGTEKTVCTMLVLPNIYKMNSGSYKLIKSNSIYNVGAFNIGEADDVIGQFGTLTITKIEEAQSNLVTTPTVEITNNIESLTVTTLVNE